MAEPNFSALGDDSSDDLPRAFRREKEARAREAMERAAQQRAAERAAAGPSLSMGAPMGPDAGQQNRPDVGPRASTSAPQIGPASDIRPAGAAAGDFGMPATVKRFDVPFGHLVRFFLKCAVAAIPAMILLGVSLWLLGAMSTLLFPNLVKLKILIGVGN